MKSILNLTSLFSSSGRTMALAGGWFATSVLSASPVSLVLYDFEGDSVAGAPAANITASAFSVSSGSIGFQNGNGGRIANASSWSEAETFSTAGKYFQFALGPTSGFEMELTSVSLLLGRTNAGPQSVTIQYSLDGFATAGTTILSGGAVTSTDVNAMNSFNLTSSLPGSAVSDQVTFRIWGYNGGTGNLRIDDVQVFGNLNSLGGPIFWDSNGATAGIGGSGTWSSTSALFTTTETGDIPTTQRANSDLVVFGGTAGTVTVDGTVEAGGGITFSTTGYLLEGGTVNLGVGNQLATGTGVTATVASTLAGSGVSVAGTGTLVLEGDLSGLTGGLTVASGAAVLAASGSLETLVVNGGSATISAGETITLTNSQLSGSGGSLAINGTLVSTVTGSGWVNPGTSVVVGSDGIVVQQGNSAATNFIFGSNVTWEAGSTFIFRDWTFTPAASNRTYEPNMVFESTGAPMAVSLGTGGNPLTFAADFTVGENVTFSYGNFGAAVNFEGDITVAGVLGHDVGASDFTLGSSRQLTLEGTGSLRIRDDHSMTMGIGSSILKTGGGIATISGGSVEFGGLREVTVSGGTLRIESELVGPNAGSRLVKLGSGTLVIDGAMSGGSVRLGLAGSTDGGRLVVNSDGGLGTGSFQFNYGTLEADGARAFANDISIGSLVGSEAIFDGDAIDFSGSVSFFGTSGTFALVVNNTTTISGSMGNTNGENLIAGGAGTLRISGDASGFTDAVTVSDSLTLLIDGTLNASSVTIGAGATVGGSGTLAGDLVLETGATWMLDLEETLMVSGTVSIGAGFDIISILGLDQTTPLGTYTLISGTSTDFSTLGLGNFGSGAPADLGNGISAYFDSGSLQLVVIPEPAHYAIGFGILALALALIRRRRLRAQAAA